MSLNPFYSTWAPRWLASPAAQTAIAALLAGPLAVVWLWRLQGVTWRRVFLMVVSLLLAYAALGILLPTPLADRWAVFFVLGFVFRTALAARKHVVPPMPLLRLLWGCLLWSGINAVLLMLFGYALYHYNLADAASLR